MAHLNEAQVLDALDGQLDAAATAHVASCDHCGGRVDELRTVLRTIEAADDDAVPEPSPLFWEQFPGRVSRAIDAEPEPTAWFGGWRWWGSAATAAVLVLLVVLPLRREATAPAPGPPVAVNERDLAAPSSTDVPLTAPEDLEDDEAWAMVRAVAEQTDYEEVRATGLRPRPGAVERAAMELSDEERAELARLIEQDARLIKQQMKRAGASTP